MRTRNTFKVTFVRAGVHLGNARVVISHEQKLPTYRLMEIASVIARSATGACEDVLDVVTGLESIERKPALGTFRVIL